MGRARLERAALSIAATGKLDPTNPERAIIPSTELDELILACSEWLVSVDAPGAYRVRSEDDTDPSEATVGKLAELLRDRFPGSAAEHGDPGSWYKHEARWIIRRMTHP